MNNLEIRPVAEYELDSWDAFVETCDHGTLFHTSAWRRAVNKSYGDGDYTIIAVRDSGEIAGGFCALTRKRLGVSTAVTPLATPYTGFILSGDYQADATLELSRQDCRSDIGNCAAALSELLRFLRVFRYQHLQCAPGLIGLQEFKKAGYNNILRRTLEINLHLPEEELWAGFEGNVRRNIKKAQKQGFEITDKWDGEAGYQVLKDTFSRNGGVCPIPIQWFAELTDGVILNDFRRRYVAWQDGNLVAFLVAMRYHGRVYYQLAGASDSVRTSGISSLLIWEMLRDHLGGGWDVFDFVGGNISAIARFKEGFNPTERQHVILEWCGSKRIKIARSAREQWISLTQKYEDEKKRNS